MSKPVDPLEQAIQAISFHIKHGDPVRAARAGSEFVSCHGAPVSARFWFQLRLAYLLSGRDDLAADALHHMEQDIKGYAPEMQRDVKRDDYLKVIRRRGSRFSRVRQGVVTTALDGLTLLWQQETHPNRIAVTLYAIARAEDALGHHTPALRHYRSAEVQWLNLENEGRGNEIDMQWRRDNRFRRLLALARLGLADPLHYSGADAVANDIIGDEGELDERRKKIARLLRATPAAYWFVAPLVGH